MLILGDDQFMLYPIVSDVTRADPLDVLVIASTYLAVRSSILHINRSHANHSVINRSPEGLLDNYSNYEM